MSTGELLVTIPTFNRRKELLATLDALRRQWAGQFNVLVLDDSSEESIESAIFDAFPDAREWMSFVRHRNRIGLSANIVACFDKAEGEWMWLLGNDDELDKKAIDTIRGALNDHPSACFINFASNLVTRTETRRVSGLDALLSQLDSHANLNFISTGVYRVACFKKYIAVGYHYAYTFSPHLAMLISFLRDTPAQTAVLHRKQICEHRRAKNPDENWSRIDFCFGAAALLELEGLTSHQRHRLAHSFGSSGKVHEFITLQLLSAAAKSGDGANGRFVLRSIVQRYFCFDKSPLRWIKKVTYPWLFYFPGFSWRFVTTAFKLLGRESQLRTYTSAPARGNWR